MTQICPYCSRFYSLNSRDIFCSQYEPKGQDLANNLFYLSDSQVTAKEHISRYTFRYSFAGYQHFTIDGYHRTLSPGSILYLENGQSFTTDTLIGSKVKLMTVAFNPVFFLGTIKLASNTHEGLLNNPFTELSPPPNSIIPLFGESLKSILYEFRELFYAPLGKNKDDLNAKLEVLIVDLLRIKQKENATALHSIDMVRFSTRKELYKRISIGRDYLKSSIQSQITIEEVCREVGMSKYHFIRTFKMFNGVTPHRYLVNERINFAKELLKNSSLDIADISTKSGYESPSAFSRAFREQVGSSAINYRN